MRFPRATHLVMVLEKQEDADRVMAVLPKRFGKYGLTIHPEKTRRVDFRRPPRGGAGQGNTGKRRLGTFDLLGFTHYWGKSRRGTPVVKRKTSASRFSRKLKEIARWCRQHRHLPVREQHAQLWRKIQGHDAYFGITGNARALARFRHGVERIWRKWLDRRSHHAKMTWARFKELLKRYPLPPVRVVHSIYRSVANP